MKREVPMAFSVQKFSVVKSTDNNVFKALLEGAIEHGLPAVRLDVVPATGTTSMLNITNGEYDLETTPIFRDVLELDSTVVTRFSLMLITNGWVHYRRMNDKPVDDLEFQFDNWQTPPNVGEIVVIKFINFLKKKLVAVDTVEYTASILSDEIQSHYQHREAELEKLIALSENVTIQVSNYRDKLQEDYAKHREDLHEEIKQDKELLKSEFSAKEQALQEREAALQIRLDEIDDRENRHVRRALRDKFVESLKERQTTFKLTSGTRNLRWPIHLAAGITIILLALANWKTFALFEQLDQFSGYQLGLLVAKQATLGLAFGSTVVFYLRWCNLWFQQHATEEFRHKRLELDIDRASWVVEVALEWKHETGETLPPDLLDRLSVELFSSHECKASESLHPADQIATAILGNSAQATIKVGDNEVVIDKKGLKALLKGFKPIEG